MALIRDITAVFNWIDHSQADLQQALADLKLARAKLRAISADSYSWNSPRPQLQLDAGIGSVTEKSPKSFAQAVESPELVDNHHVASHSSKLTNQK